MHSVHEKVMATDGPSRNLPWLSHPQLFNEIVQDFRQGRYRCHATLMLMCPILERSLGNILFSRAPDVAIPPLLRDLVSSRRLITVIGRSNAIVLDLFFGSPHSVNLRNIIWHGFAQDSDLPSVFVTNIYFLCASIQIRISDGGAIVPRPFIVLAPDIEFPQETPDESSDECPDLRNAIRSHHHLLITAELLIKMEFQLRRIFCAVNKCHQRTLTAENSRVYITFKEMFSSTIDDSGTENKLLSFLGVDVLNLLMDLLILPKGPRIRDRLGHGELDLSQSENFEKWAKTVTFVKIRIAESETDKVVECQYRPQFHPIFIVIRSIETLVPTICDLQSSMGTASKDFAQVLDLEVDPLPDLSSWRDTILTRCQGIPFNLLDRPPPECSVISIVNRWTRALKDFTVVLAKDVHQRTRKLHSQESSLRHLSSSRKLFSMFQVVSETVLKSIISLTFVLKDLQSLDPMALGQIQKTLKQTCIITEKTVALVDKSKYDELKYALTAWFNLLTDLPHSQ
ncbi:hypothetical protein TCAL_08444 [Tigriopus californicus]|uniref:DUF4209 domain-containing protein n=2 Tax=Tigriopus californicus TaxID=6832 RepID=A0A553P3W7_TIGCA|nr:hypothetical protein TCAL_08444 [Tigriopus californicus]|eukprot:TCALIF_08444-PA protein Name:"Similar to Ermard Endoplasmic reticulum membrane-associated RNA degradation protein (Rattus norvegicus)" AED:0.50 eAED:0.50 QI:0/-1/0/1/-1/1/1/0/511